jgi:hypothetical protein
MGTLDVTYPGFAKAVSHRSSNSDTLSDPWPETTYPTPRPIVGTERFHLLRFEITNSSVDSYVCSYGEYTTAYDLGGEFGYQPGGLDDGVALRKISLTAPENPTHLAPQRGPARAPSTDVFDGWKITAMLRSEAQDDPRWPTLESDMQACRDRAPDPIERRKFLRQGKHPRSDYPTLAPYPGWPEGSSN